LFPCNEKVNTDKAVQNTIIDLQNNRSKLCHLKIRDQSGNNSSCYHQQQQKEKHTQAAPEKWIMERRQQYFTGKHVVKKKEDAKNDEDRAHHYIGCMQFMDTQLHQAVHQDNWSQDPQQFRQVFSFAFLPLEQFKINPGQYWKTQVLVKVTDGMVPDLVSRRNR
jgi:ATPase subunit of ABC transporter with duplicated ATPase domains